MIDLCLDSVTFIVQGGGMQDVWELWKFFKFRVVFIAKILMETNKFP